MLILVEGSDLKAKLVYAQELAQMFNWPYRVSCAALSTADEFMDDLLRLGKEYQRDTLVMAESFITHQQRWSRTDLWAMHLVARFNGYLKVDLDRNTYRKGHEHAGRFANMLREKASERIADGLQGTGNPDRAKLFIVGEQVNPRITWRGLPFDRGRAAEFLAVCLMCANMDISEVYMINAVRPDGQPENLLGNLARAKTYNPTAPIVALGRIAERELTKQGIQHHALPHPSHMLRFKCKQQDWYVDQFRRILDLTTDPSARSFVEPMPHQEEHDAS